jgi:hypothetical protein
LVFYLLDDLGIQAVGRVGQQGLQTNLGFRLKHLNQQLTSGVKALILEELYGSAQSRALSKIVA